MTFGADAEENPTPARASSAITIAAPASRSSTTFKSFSAWWALSAANWCPASEASLAWNSPR